MWGILLEKAAVTPAFEKHSQRGLWRKAPRAERRGSSQPRARLFSNSSHRLLKVSPHRKCHPMTWGWVESARGAINSSRGHRRSDKESTLRWSPRKGGGGVVGGGRGEIRKVGDCPDGSFCPIYPSHAVVPPYPRRRSFNWLGTQCLLKHQPSLEKGSVGECAELSQAANI